MRVEMSQVVGAAVHFCFGVSYSRLWQLGHFVGLGTRGVHWYLHRLHLILAILTIPFPFLFCIRVGTFII